eukprot:jgi/Galph1/4379/GphlegSOOS_G3043.1
MAPFLFTDKKDLLLLFCSVNIYICYLLYGVLQERLYKTKYAPDNLVFGHSLFLIFVQCFSHTLFSFACCFVSESSKYSRKEQTLLSLSRYQPKALFKGYGLIAATYLLAMVFSNHALHYVSYPIQTIAKSSKMIPVMFMGIVIRNRKYSFFQYCRVLLLTLGVFLFSYQKTHSKSVENRTELFGIALLFASLIMDGLTGPLQETFIQDRIVSTHEIMFFQNLFSSFYLAVALFWNNGWKSAWNFIQVHPQVLRDMAIFCVTSCIGQSFIVYTVCHYSSLVCATITTTRKFLSVLLSFMIFRHSPSSVQLIGFMFVIIAVFWEIRGKYQTSKIK